MRIAELNSSELVKLTGVASGHDDNEVGLFPLTFTRPVSFSISWGPDSVMCFRVTDSCGLNPDPTFEKKKNPDSDPTVKNNRIQNRPYFDLMKVTLEFFS